MGAGVALAASDLSGEADGEPDAVPLRAVVAELDAQPDAGADGVPPALPDAAALTLALAVAEPDAAGLCDALDESDARPLVGAVAERKAVTLPGALALMVDVTHAVVDGPDEPDIESVACALSDDESVGHELPVPPTVPDTSGEREAEAAELAVEDSCDVTVGIGVEESDGVAVVSGVLDAAGESVGRELTVAATKVAVARPVEDASPGDAEELTLTLLAAESEDAALAESALVDEADADAVRAGVELAEAEAVAERL